jgi:hypothetical protein
MDYLGIDLGLGIPTTHQSWRNSMGMTKDEIIEIARQAGFPFNKYDLLQGDDEGEIDAHEMFEAFAKLVAARTLMNIDPSSFMSYQEGFEAGNKLAIDGFCKQLRQLHDAYSCASDPSTLRARGGV